MKHALMILFLVFALVLLSTNMAWATEEGIASEYEKPEASLLYYLEWLAVVTIFLLSLFYVYQSRRTKYRYEGKWLGYVFIFLVSLAYFMTYHPALREYQELPILGFIRFLVAVSNGALLAFYGVLGRPGARKGARK